MILRIDHAGTNLAIKTPGLDEGGPLQESEETRACHLIERVGRLEVSGPQAQAVGEAVIFDIRVLDRGDVIGEVDFELVGNVVEEDAFHAETRTAEFGRVDVRSAGDVEVLIDGVVVGLKAAADFEREFAVRA